MLTEIEFEAWCRDCNLAEETIKQIQAIRTSPPSRLVDGGKKSVSGRYPSQKMGHTIQFESHRNELAQIYRYEFDDEVLEYWDQPHAIYLDYLSKSGRRNYHSHTPDFFVIRRNGAGWEECKTEKELLSLAESSPNRWKREDEGKWHCPPGEEYAQKFGLYYAVRSSAEINSVFVRNFEWLEDYFFPDEPLKADEEITLTIQNLVQANPGITLAEIRQQVQQANADGLHILIATGKVFVDLETYLLPQPEGVKVFLCEQTYTAYKLVTTIEPCPAFDIEWTTIEIGTSLLWDGETWTIVNTGNQFVSLINIENKFTDLPNNVFQTLVQEGRISGLPETPVKEAYLEVEEIWRRASKKVQDEALHRYKIIEPVLNGEKSSSTLTRNEQRWLSQYLKAEKVKGNGFIGLLPNYSNRGWRRDGIPLEVREFMERHIEENYLTVVQKSIRHVYGSFRSLCESKGYVPPSLEKYRQVVRSYSIHEQTEKRMGERAAYKEEDEIWYLHREETPPHGDRSFQCCHIDHTEVPVELLSEIMLWLGLDPSTLKERLNMGKAWVTTLIDAYDRRILAVHMSFDKPSYRSIMKVLRICVRRHKRLPKIIVVDGGPDFKSSYFEILLAWFRITKKQRPKTKSRNGTVIEGFFGVADKEFWHQLMGNTKIMKCVRQVTQKVNPKNHAVWTLLRLYAYFCEYCYSVYNDSPHPALRMTPNEAFAIGLTRSGLREHTYIQHEEFNLLSLPAPKEQDGTRKATKKGIKVHYIWYWHESFNKIRNTREDRVNVKYDPFDFSVVYAYVKGEWVKCHCKQKWELEWLKGRSEKEWMIATEELKKLNELERKSSNTITGRQLADFFRRVEMAEAALSTSWRDAKTKVAIQHWRDVEQQFIDTLVEGKSSEPETEHLVKLLNLSINASNAKSDEELDSQGTLDKSLDDRSDIDFDDDSIDINSDDDVNQDKANSNVRKRFVSFEIA
ncbi:MAG: Mu transposase C-terminal domain-containing protein [Leptolyngbya sp. BL-A-14]